MSAGQLRRESDLRGQEQLHEDCSYGSIAEAWGPAITEAAVRAQLRDEFIACCLR